MTRTLLLSVLLSTSSLLMAAPLSEEQAIAKGSEVSATLLQTLSGEVKAHMQSDGPLKTLHFCSQNALILTDEIAKSSHTSIKRVSKKNRNPVNNVEPETDEQLILNLWESQIAAGEPVSHKYKQISDKQGVYYKPILINNEACLKCHGDIDADSPVAKAIRSLYPNDLATGYKMGDLRGMIVITIPR